MACPICDSNDVCARPKQRAFYPLAPVVILGLSFAMLHQVSEARVFHCAACGHKFRRRTVIARIAFVLLMFLIAMFAVSIFGLIVTLGGRR